MCLNQRLLNSVRRFGMVYYKYKKERLSDKFNSVKDFLIKNRK